MKRTHDAADALGQNDAPSHVGPLLYFRGCDEDRLRLAALIVRPVGEPPPVVSVATHPIQSEVLLGRCGLAVLRYEFDLPATGGAYIVDDQAFEVAGLGNDNLRLAYASCNGQERGDRERPSAVRNVMWQRLAQQHREHPISLMLHGGDQLYADEMLDTHPDVRAWGDREALDWSNEEAARIAKTAVRDFLFHRYLQLFSQPELAWLYARVPSLCMWDDHDICDGWGSLLPEQLDSPIGEEVFYAAREFFLLFQLGCNENALPGICNDPQGRTLTWTVKLPGALVVAPDLRSERRPERIMGPAGWKALEEGLAAAGSTGRVIVLSSVPLLGPRLSLVEAVLHLLPGMQKYEDDLRDQWQSHAHRDEWCRMLQVLLDLHERGNDVTVLSGEIHLATRGTMETNRGPFHQLIASGITHPPPTPWYGRVLGALARLGEAPLRDHPIRLHPLPGQRRIYTSERNFLILESDSGTWSAKWELEESGSTPQLQI